MIGERLVRNRQSGRRGGARFVKRFSMRILSIGVLFISCVSPVLAGDSLYGKVIEVKSADLVVFDYGVGKYELRLVGIEEPPQKALATMARSVVSNLALDKNMRMRFEGRNEKGEMLARLFTDDPQIGIKEVAVELVRQGLVMRLKNFDFKYGELAAAEREARSAKRGLWATQ